MGLGFDDLKQELMDRGLSDVGDTRAGRYINAARAELDRMYLWPWRESFAVGVAPLVIADLGPIESVTNETQEYPLQVAQFYNLQRWYGDLTNTGNPQYYYVGTPSGSSEVATYPVTSDTIGVQYWKVTPDISGSTEPASPDEAHLLIVDIAQQRALGREKGDWAGAAAMQPEIDRQIDELVAQYPPGTADGQGMTVVSIFDGWGIW